MSLNVTIPDTFDGPLGLLLYLIKRDEIDIFDIPMAKLASSYIEELRRLEKIANVDEAAKFLDLASRLLEIKSRMLVPPEERAEGEEDDDDFDPRSGLVAALLEYRRFKDAARLLAELAEEQARRYPRMPPPPEFAPVTGGVARSPDGAELLRAFQNLFLRLAPRNESNVITYTEIPTAVRIRQIETVLAEAGRTKFSLLLSGSPSRREITGFFIAILELIRQGRLVARQSENYSDIVLERRQASSASGETLRKTAHRLSTPRCFMSRRDSGGGYGGKTDSGLPPRPFPAPAPRRSENRGGTPRRKMFSPVFALSLIH